MTYASAYRRPNPVALAGALGLPGAMAAVLVAGLAVTVVSAPEQPRPQGWSIADIAIPPPPPPAPDTPGDRRETRRPNTTLPTATATRTDSDTETDLPLPDPGGELGKTAAPAGTAGTGEAAGPTGSGGPGLGAEALRGASPFDPVAARPRGNPGRWVTNEDYRRRWVHEDLAGTARFRLAIDASGKVTGCTITGSTGHRQLDQATCELVTRRARFDPARGRDGKAAAGSYTGSVTWAIP